MSLESETKRLADAAEKIAAVLTGAAVTPTKSETKPKPAAPKPAAEAKPAETKTETKPKPAAAATKSQAEVRDVLRQVVEANGKAAVTELLDTFGGGVEKVSELKPEFYDKVYTAAREMLGEKGTADTAAAADDDPMG